MAIYFQDLAGMSYLTEAPTKKNDVLNGDGLLQITIIKTEQNEDFFDNISKRWKIWGIEGRGDIKRYVITNLTKKTIKHTPTLAIVAREDQIDYLSNRRIYENITGSRTANNYFSTIFEGTPYSFSLQSTVNAVEWENAGEGENRLDMFLKGLDRYGLEYTYDHVSRRFDLISYIKREPSYFLSRKVNADDFTLEEDAANMSTYIQGYGNFTDEDGMSKAKLKKTYQSNLYDIFGKLEAQPIIDGRITKETTLNQKMKERVDNSILLSLTLDFKVMMDDYPFAQPLIGDTIMVIDDSIGFKQKVRIVEIDTERDGKNTVKKQTVTLGHISRLKRRQNARSQATDTVNDWVNGEGKVPIDVLPPAIKSASHMLLSTTSQLSYSDKGILAVDKSNPNYVTLMNSSGLGVSNDGGQTFRSAITRGAINADLITAGSLTANIIKGGMLTSRNKNVSLNLDKGEFEIGNSTIKYLQPRNAIRYSSSGYTSGVHFSNDTNSRASAVIGTALGNNEMDSNSAYFTGFKAIATDLTNELWGFQTIIRDNSQKIKGNNTPPLVWSFDHAQSSESLAGVRAIVGYGKPHLGREKRKFETVWTRNINKIIASDNRLNFGGNAEILSIGGVLAFKTGKGKYYTFESLFRTLGITNI